MEVVPSEQTGIPSAGDEIAGKYRVEHVIGQGGMGAVFAARNTLTGKRVAIKWLLPEHAGSIVRERLRREAQLAASIDHPNVVNIYDIGEHEGGLFLVMEYLPGRPLSDVMKERGRFDPPELIALLLPAMRGVHAAHLAGVVHRDLKPENIILCELDGEVVPKVVDFGISKEVGISAVPNASLTRTGTLVGTPHYMALEQIDDSIAIDARTDVYAFGVLLYRGLTGAYPFDGSSVAQVILNIGMKEAEPMRLLRSDLPAELDAIVLRALSRDIHMRFASLEELGRALIPFAAAAEPGGPTSQHGSWRTSFISAHGLSTPSAAVSARASHADGAPLSAPERDGRRPGRRVWIAVALLASVASAALAAWPHALRSPDAEEPRAHNQRAKQEAEDLQSGSRPAALEPPATAHPALSAPQSEPPSGDRQASRGDALARELQPAARAEGVAAHPHERESAATKSRRNAPTRSKQERSAPASSGSAAALIPGKRTNGLSPDEF